MRKTRVSIVNIGSIEGLAANPGHAAYCTSKAALHGLKLEEAKRYGSLIEASEVADAMMYMLIRPRGVTIRDRIIMPTNFDL